MYKDALISKCKKYRYWLSRVWDLDKPALLFIMLNPSKANALIDDPTITRCINFAKALGYGGIHVVNLFAYRATKPTALTRAQNPIGPENNYWIKRLSLSVSLLGGKVVAAWGTKGDLGNRAEFVSSILSKFTLYCLAQTQDNHPGHPLFLKSNSKLSVYRKGA